MPFKSEKQRRYLWANEPEIARDWTETYGSKIKKAEGGRIGFYRGKGTSSSRSSSKDTSNDYGQFSRAVSRAANNPTRSSVPDRGGNEGQFQRRIDQTAAKKQMAEREARDSISNRVKQHGLNANRRLAYQQMGLIPKQGFNLGITGAILNSITGKMPTNLSNLTDDEAEALALEVNKMKAGGQNVSVDVDLFDRVKEGQGLLNQNQLNQSEYERLFPGPTGNTGGGGEGGGNPYIYPTTPVASAAESSEQSDFDKYLAGLGGDYLVPIDYVQNRTRAATGGLMDIVDRESIIKTPDEEIVTNQMEEIEGQMAGPEWFTLRVQELMQFEDMSYEEASEQAYEEGPYGGDYAQGGRVPAAFGGIMDTYSGRRKYGFGSFFKSITKPIKKILKSPLGKAAAMAGLGYLATPGTGASIFSPKGKGSWWKKLLLDSVDSSGRSADVPGLLTKGKKLLSNPFVSIPAAASAAGLMTAKMPVEELDQADDEYDMEKEAFDAYLASLGGSYRVPDEYILAKGGRVGRQEGGLMDLGGMEKDYRNDGGFVPIGGEEKADDVPARLSRNEFVFTARCC